MTLSRDEIMAMSADELRVAIARKQGWKYQEDAPPDYDKRIKGWWISPAQLNVYGNPKAHTGNSRPFPDYPHDIASAYQLEESVPEGDDRFEYAYIVAQIIDSDRKPLWWTLVHATAEQRSRAYLIWRNEHDA